MSKFFLAIYEWFGKHPALFRTILALSVLVCAVFASRVRFDENITSFFDGGEQSAVFDNLRIKDKIVVLVSGEDPDEIVDVADAFVAQLEPAVGEGLIRSVTDGIDEEAMEKSMDFIYGYLPIFLTDADYARIGQELEGDGVAQAVDHAYSMVSSASGVVIGDMLLRDPLGIGIPLMSGFERFASNVDYELYAGRIFTEDLSSLLLFIDPAYGMGDTGRNGHLVDRLEKAAAAAGTEGTKITCIGGPVIAVHNARQIKHDTTVTLSIALFLIILVIFLSFRNRRSIPLIIVPPAFGALFALAGVGLVQGNLSAIAVGAGAVVLGVALSYSIHFISHLNHTSDPRQVITDLAAPLTIGCLTTIGAFAALMFTSSALLRDIGLFSVFTLIGTTIFCLVFLPQFLRNFNGRGHSRLLRIIERGNAYAYEDNKWIVLLFAAATVVCLFFYNDVKFDTDMSNINYMPAEIEEAEKRVGDVTGDAGTYVVSSAPDLDGLAVRYGRLEALLQDAKDAAKIRDYVVLDNFFIPTEEQEARIARWNSFWEDRREAVCTDLRSAAARKGFRDGAFSRFEALLYKEFEPCRYTPEEIGEVPALGEWIETGGDAQLLISRVFLDEDSKEEVYAAIADIPGTMVVDRAWFSSMMLENTVNDFNYILLISSLIVFIALLLSYGRLELTLMTFLPMCISWVIILGLMAIFDIRFNVVNIILATFIFGIGDDFSIFIMDGLLQEYRTGQKLLGAHKTAIFFSAFTAVAGMGVLIFAKHPALKSIALISVLGLCVVVLVAYTVQPWLFRLLVGTRDGRDRFPYTFSSLLVTAGCFLYFLAGCVLIQLLMVILLVLSHFKVFSFNGSGLNAEERRKWRKKVLHRVICGFTRLFLNSMLTVKVIRKVPEEETFGKPAVIIANHQSFIDILLMLSLTPNLVMVTNSWVWHSPFFGRIVRGADFLHAQDGFDALARTLEEKVRDGYSVMIFPEGTRSEDGRVGRFRKGAFCLAERLGLDILPVVLYGTGMVCSKRQPFYIKRGIVAAHVMPRVRPAETADGDTCRAQARRFRRMFVEELERLDGLYGRTSNPWFRDALIKNYLYKGPVLEWYMRVKCRLDGYYDLWDRLVPRDASVVDVGCGYGQLSIMLGLLSPGRKVLGLDYDADKIALADHSFLSGGPVRFACADMRDLDLPEADAYIFNDSLHYVGVERQYAVLAQAASRLRDGGMILVRDGDASDAEGQARIDRTEKWSVGILRFNKTDGALAFTDAAGMRTFAAEQGLELQVRRCDKDSSETLYVFRKKKAAGDGTRQETDENK